MKVPARDIQRQRAIAGELKAQLSGKRYHIVTYGCQMNAHESEIYAGIFGEMGMVLAPTRWEADIVLFNTCCIRDNAERRLFGNIGKLHAYKKEERPDLLIGVCGCVAQQQGAAEKLLKRFPLLDFVAGTQGMHRLPELIGQAREARLDAVVQDERIAEGQPVRRADPYRAYLSIMYGCDNYCAYCIVPYVRGRERSRDAADIVAQAEALAADGVKEITLLGQNVNSFDGGMRFDGLLRALDGVVPRIRFMTSHPKDISEEVISAMADCPSIARQLHLPAQSGSDDILRAMNRRYDAQRYRSIVDAARQAMPDIGITTDIIVGFPGESEAGFNRTLDLMRWARFDGAFTFAFSPRRGTKAASMQGQIDEDTKAERLRELIALQEDIQAQVYQGLLGTRHQMLIEGPSKRGSGVVGRIGRGITVNAPGGPKPGEMREVIIDQAKQKTLYGRWE